MKTLSRNLGFLVPRADGKDSAEASRVAEHPTQRWPAVVALGLLAVGATFGAPLHGQSDAQGGQHVVIPLLTGPITLDGRVDEPAWEEVPVLPAVMHRPTYLGTPTEATEFRVAHDGAFLYLGCRLYDSDPSGIRALSLQRDETSFSNDWCAIGLDTFFDRENMHLVGINPAGQRTDVVFTNDAVGAPDPDWNTFGDAEVSQDGDGWEAEIRIPFSSLRFQETKDGVTMGLMIFRNIARKNEVHTYPAVQPRWGSYSFFKASQSQPVVFRGVESTNPLYVTPYAIGGAGYAHDENEAETGYDRATSRVREVGLDLKYGLTENLTLDVSVNTDFAQVEADDEQVNLTRFSLFFPEKRPFFKERDGVFEYSLGGNERLFHSRRIGLSEGEPLRIFGGARVVGRIGEWDVGALTMQTEAPEEDGSPENTAVLRLRRRVWNENSYLNGILTSRLGNDATENVLYGFDAILRLFGQDYLILNWAQSFDGEDGSDVGGIDRSLARFYWQRRGVDGLAYEADFTRAGEAFEPGLGFLLRRDYTKSRASLGYGWRPGPESPLLRYALTAEAVVYHRGDDGYLETGEFKPTVDLELKSGHTLTGSFLSTHEHLDEGFEPSENTEVLAGQYTYSVGSLEFTQSTGDRIRTDLSAEYGGYFDGRRASASVTTTGNPSRHLEVQGVYRIDDVVFEERDQRFRAHIARVRVEPRLNTKLTGAVLAQYNSASNAFLMNARLRWNPREGTDLYVVWNEGLVTDRRSFDPIRPFSEQRTVVVKYSHTFTMGF